MMVRKLVMLVMVALAAMASHAHTPPSATFIDDEGFDMLMEQGDAGKVVFLDFSADWCAPCHTYAPTFDAMAEHYGRQALFFRVDVDKSPRLVERYNVSSVPLTVAVHTSERYFRTIGDIEMSALQSFILRNLISYKTDHPEN